MFGYEKSYAELLEESGLKSLKERRISALDRFARKAARNPTYKKWFQENTNPRQSQRHPTPYIEKLARTNRLYKSPIYTMTRLLNGDASDQMPEQDSAFDHNLNDPYAL